MRRLHLRWSSDPHDTGPTPANGDLVLAFTRSSARAEDAVEVVFADDLLDWQTRSEIEHRVGDLLEALRAQVPDAELVEASEYELRLEWLAVLSAQAVGRALRAAGPFAELRPSTKTPRGIVAGVSSALRIAAPTPTPTRSNLTIGARRATFRSEVAKLIVTTRAATTSRHAIHVLAFPATKLADALGELSREQLGGLNIAVAGLAGLGHGKAAKLILRRGLPAVALPTHPVDPPPAPPVSVSHLTGDPDLDAALADVARAALASGSQLARGVATMLPALERLDRLRAIVLPTAALSATRLLGRWAARHGIRVASFQHGIYGLIEGDGGDRRADVLFGWGSAVERQVAMWTAPRPRLEVVGAPGLARAGHPPRKPTLQRVLVATTAGPFVTALAPWNTREDFLDALTDGLARLRAVGVGVELRLHPRESAQEYELFDRYAGRDPLPLAPAGPFTQVAQRADLLIAPFSSAAFEAAALAIPVAMWTPRVPAAIRTQHFLPPLSDDLPGTFANAADFDALVARVLDNRTDGLEPAMRLSRTLATYVQPLDTRRFAAVLAELGS